MDQERERLRAAIVEQHGTIHRFCRRNQHLNRPTVYLVLNGKYPGNMERQVKKIRMALSGEDKSESVFKAIKSKACCICSKKGECHQCDKLFRSQANAVMKIFSD
ncbi:hypothetical protein [Maridesulfovibrio bastinii]|uniref:hypothetical protein n=1 Tax=Maridesulfovibrio bastinii TaxID=47157 RepID=UPI000688FEC2|nr:hypothetical protein [Maridesulfovibrio bastinii]